MAGVAQYGTQRLSLRAQIPRDINYLHALTELKCHLRFEGSPSKKISWRGFRRWPHEGLAPCKGAVRAVFTTTLRHARRPMPRALNKMTKGGVGYKRPPDIEASIDEALGQKPEEQLRRANIR